MRLKNKVQELEEDCQESFDNVKADIDSILNGYRVFVKEFNELRDELATNGVIRDIRKLQKENKILKDALAGLNGYVGEVEANLDELTRHTASLIMQHDQQINQTQFEDKRKQSLPEMLWGEINGGSRFTPMQPTLAGKVDAIIEHLGLDVTVKPEEVTESKVEAKKKKVTKKGKK